MLARSAVETPSRRTLSRMDSNAAWGASGFDSRQRCATRKVLSPPFVTVRIRETMTEDAIPARDLEGTEPRLCTVGSSQTKEILGFSILNFKSGLRGASDPERRMAGLKMGESVQVGQCGNGLEQARSAGQAELPESCLMIESCKLSSSRKRNLGSRLSNQLHGHENEIFGESVVSDKCGIPSCGRHVGNLIDIGA
jgi:hypothetical protein